MENRLPKHILKSLERNRTSLGEHPSFPPDEEEKFLFKVISSFYNTIDEKVKGVDFENMKKELSVLIKQAVEHESNNRSSMEQLCNNIVCELFEIPEDTIDIECNIVDKVDSTNQRLVPEKTDNYTFDNIQDMKNLTDEIYKRRMLNCLVSGISSYYANNISSYVQELFKINPELPNLYRKIIELNNKLMFLQMETLDQNNSTEGGKVDVNISSTQSRVSIKAEGIIFPILLSETIKGLLELSISHGLPKNKEKAEYVMKKADFRLAELWDARIGVPLWMIMENMFNESGHMVEEVGVNFIMMKISEMPPHIFNTFLQEVFMNTKSGKKMCKALIDNILEEKSRDEFDDFMNQNINTDRTQLDDGYFTSEEMGEMLLQEEMPLEEDNDNEVGINYQNMACPLYGMSDKSVKIGNPGESLRDFKMRLVLDSAGYDGWDDYKEHQNNNFVEAQDNFNYWLDFINTEAFIRAFYWVEQETLSYVSPTPYKSTIIKHFESISKELGRRIDNPKIMIDNEPVPLAKYRGRKYDNTPDSVMVDDVFYDFKDGDAYPFVKFNDGYKFGDRGESHETVKRQYIAELLGFDNITDVAFEIDRLKHIGKKEESDALLDKQTSLSNRLHFDMRYKLICGRVWMKKDIQIIAFWNKEVNKEDLKETVGEISRHFNTELNNVQVISKGEVVSYDELNGVENGEDIEKLRNIHLMNQQDKREALKDFRRNRAEVQSRKLGKIPMAQYHNMLYQESKINEAYNVASVDNERINTIEYSVYVDEDGERLYNVTCWDYDGNDIFQQDDLYEDELEYAFDERYVEMIVGLQGKEIEQDHYIIKDILYDDMKGCDEDLEKANHYAKKMFQASDTYIGGDRGYILTDGTILEFSGYTDHLNICAVRGLTLGKFVAMGAIRIGSKSIYLQQPPTNEQRRQLKRLINYYSDEELYVDIVEYNGGNYSNNLTSARYIHPEFNRVMGEIDRFFNEGIKLQGGGMYESEDHFEDILEEAATSLSDIYAKYYSSIPERDFLQILAADPTTIKDSEGNPKRMGNYCKWMLKLHMNDRLKLEDLYKATDYLKMFDKKKKFIEGGADVNRFKSLPDLFNAVRPFMEDSTLGMSNAEKEAEAKKGAEKVYEDNEWLVVVPHTQEASCYYGKGTQWCTAADKSNNMFEHYSEQGDLYININKHTGEKYQFHFESESFMDENDEPIDTPIMNSIEMTQGLINFYKEERDDSDYLKIVETKHDFYDHNGAVVCSLCTRPDKDYWYLKDGGETIIADGLNVSYSEIESFYDDFSDGGYILIPNIWDSNTLFTLNYYNDVEYWGYEVEEVECLEREEGASCILFIRKTYGRAAVLDAYSGTYIYSTKTEGVESAEMFYGSVVKITKENGLYDFVEWSNEERIYDIEEYQVDEHSYSMTTKDKYGEYARYSLEDLSEMENEFEDDEEDMHESKKSKRVIKLSEAQLKDLKKFLLK